MTTIQDLAKLLKHYSNKSGVIVTDKDHMTFETRWSLYTNEFIDSDGKRQILEDGEEYSKIRVSNFKFIIQCRQQNGVPMNCILYVKDSKQSTLDYVKRVLKTLF